MLRQEPGYRASEGRARDPPAAARPRRGHGLAPHPRRASLRDRHPPCVSPKRFPDFLPSSSSSPRPGRTFLSTPASAPGEGSVSGRPSPSRPPAPARPRCPAFPAAAARRSARPGQARGRCQRPALFISQVPPRARRSRARRRRPSRHPRPPPRTRPRGPLPAPAGLPALPRRRAENGPEQQPRTCGACPRAPSRGTSGGARDLPAAAGPRSPAGSSGAQRSRQHPRAHLPGR